MANEADELEKRGIMVLSAGAMSVLASLVGLSVEQLGDRFGPGATGVLQSALGNLPELFICIFALRAGLVDVVRAALIGSILAKLGAVPEGENLPSGFQPGRFELETRWVGKNPWLDVVDA